MGEVWQARDTKLDRDVALKVLPEAFTSDPDRLARFEREAKVLASLNHPNIGSIYGLEEAEGVRALVLELVKGPTLADRIKQGPIPLDEALPIAKQIAAALEAAHEQGVIHRDLKPANVKVKDDGTVKVLDFGLAKAFQPEAGGTSASESPTILLTAAATQMGMVIGTAAYMSPEQAKGKPVDKRADVWAFGAVLFEMLTGRKPFVGDDVSDTLALVLKFEPEWDSLPTEVPARIRQLIQTCLQKKPKQRVHDIADVRLAMEGAFEAASTAPSEPAAAAPLQVWQRPGAIAATALVTLALGGLAVGTMMRPEPAPAPDLMGFGITLPESGPLGFSDLAISPDGNHIIYTGLLPGGDGTQLYRRPIDQLIGEPLGGTEGASAPFVSSDSQWVGFQARTASRSWTLQKVSIFGGPPVTLATLPSNIRGASWGADDQIIFGTIGAGLFQVPGGGGEPEALTTPDAEQGERDHRWPSIISNRGAVLFAATGGDSLATSELVVLALETEEVTRLGIKGTAPHYVETGHLVYAAPEGSMRAVPFDVARLEVTGSPVPLIDAIGIRTSGGASFSVSDNGRLVYTTEGGGSSPRVIVWVDRNGREEPLSELSPAGYRSVDVSPDGTLLALERADGRTASDVWIYDLARGTLSPLTTDPAEDYSPLWTPDGSQVVFASARGDTQGLYRRNADGSGDAEQLYTDAEVTTLSASSWSSAGDTLVVARRSFDSPPRNDLMLVSVEGEPTGELLLESEFDERRADISPNGEWIAYESTRSGRSQIYVERFPDLGDRRPISTNGGLQPRWAPDGRELFYLGPAAGRLMIVPITTETGFRAGTPEVLVEGPFYNFRSRTNYDVAPDGRVVIIKPGAGASENEAAPQITVVLNWHQELLERVPVN